MKHLNTFIEKFKAKSNNFDVLPVNLFYCPAG